MRAWARPVLHNAFLHGDICCYLFLGSYKKKYKKIYIKKYSEEIQKIIGARKGCWNAEKRSKLVKEVQKYKN